MFPIPPKHDTAVVRHCRALIESGALRPVIDRPDRLEQIVETRIYVEIARKIGNVLIDVAHAR